ncbi:MAG TPA: cytochrome c [Burkholderiaceae bacterium]|nr:cytochrome c [Burkholderiaceae bacterium]HQR69867.1 cytochrome c [Burkholderiaceae bacterium]
MTRPATLLFALAALGVAVAASTWWLWPREVVINQRDRVLVARGEPLYRQHCASCHGAKLEGQPDWTSRNARGRLPAPPHDDSGHTWHHDDEVLFEVTKYGIARHAPPGYESDMPAFGKTMSDDEIVATLAYIKSRWSPVVQGKRRAAGMN